jgi:hypothetical protein
MSHLPTDCSQEMMNRLLQSADHTRTCSRSGGAETKE